MKRLSKVQVERCNAALLWLLLCEKNKRTVRVDSPAASKFIWEALRDLNLIELEQGPISNYWKLTATGREKARSLKKAGTL